jgi:hypothetical protein
MKERSGRKAGWRPRKYRQLLEKFQAIEFYMCPGEKNGKIYMATSIEFDRNEVNCLRRLLVEKIEENEARRDLLRSTEKILKERKEVVTSLLSRLSGTQGICSTTQVEA